MPLTPEQIQSAFHLTASAIGPDIFQACEEAGEEQLLPIECVVSFLEAYGGEHGKAVNEWVWANPEWETKLVEMDLSDLLLGWV
jgi:hypothetical protein